MIVRRECDVAMARSKNLFPCDKDCKNCMACIEMTDKGERRHCTRHKRNTLLDARIQRAGMEPEKMSKIPLAPREQQRPWTEIEEKRALYLAGKGMDIKQIAEKLGRPYNSVKNKLRRLRIGEES